eukprot:9557654-Ditylum_brightwellii.AAC.1
MNNTNTIKDNPHTNHRSEIKEIIAEIDNGTYVGGDKCLLKRDNDAEANKSDINDDVSSESCKADDSEGNDDNDENSGRDEYDAPTQATMNTKGLNPMSEITLKPTPTTDLALQPTIKLDPKPTLTTTPVPEHNTVIEPRPSP